MGGVVQKVAAAKAAGAEIFIVPRGEYAEAREHAGSDLRVYPVDTLDDAMKVLDRLGGNALTLGRPGQGANRT